jgi:hypothetical protein
MAIEFAVQRLEIGDVVLIALPEQGGEVEATVVREIDRTVAAENREPRPGSESFLRYERGP